MTGCSVRSLWIPTWSLHRGEVELRVFLFMRTPLGHTSVDSDMVFGLCSVIKGGFGFAYWTGP